MYIFKHQIQIVMKGEILDKCKDVMRSLQLATADSDELVSLLASSGMLDRKLVGLLYQDLDDALHSVKEALWDLIDAIK